jgi:nitrate reductase NapAB chaperone NapD
MLEILVKAIEQNANVIEVPMVLHSQKRQGKSKLKMIKTTLAYLRFLFFRRYN